jgi:hypothetical protein
MRRVDISTGTDPGVTFAQHILHPRSPNAKSLHRGCGRAVADVRCHNQRGLGRSRGLRGHYLDLAAGHQEGLELPERCSRPRGLRELCAHHR